jgi:hypothetical protein
MLLYSTIHVNCMSTKDNDGKGNDAPGYGAGSKNAK